MNLRDSGKAAFNNKEKKYNPPKKYVPSIISKFVNWVEFVNSTFSIHGDKPIYNKEEFNWVLEIERDWKKVRAELDNVMKMRDELPSFHEIIKQVDKITSDNNWKTVFFSRVRCGI